MVKHLDSRGTEAGEVTTSELGISVKGSAADFATAIDLENEIAMLERLEKEFPSHSVIGEESTGTGSPDPLTADPTWIVDPIDGTTNFAAGLPLTCVSIGFCDGGEPVLGCVYSPATRELYLAVKGMGAYRNGHRIRGTTEKKKHLLDSVVCFEFGYARSEEAVDLMVGAVKRILMNGCRTTRSLGSGVLDLCYVASGRLDVVYCGTSDEGWKPWDYCAATVICNEASCTIAALQGNSNFDEKGNWIRHSKFDIYSNSMICAVTRGLAEETRRIILGLKK
jgi:fructose-1,6-bisphosphatase/inositol monophosphatase family enzyme